jgi:hypothetical protein
VTTQPRSTGEAQTGVDRKVPPTRLPCGDHDVEARENGANHLAGDGLALDLPLDQLDQHGGPLAVADQDEGAALVVALKVGSPCRGYVAIGDHRLRPNVCAEAMSRDR